MNKILNYLNMLLVVFLTSFMFYKLIFFASTMTTSKILTTLCIIPIIMVPYLLDKIIGYHMSETLKLLYYLFVIIALILGSLCGWYYKISWFDLLAHFLSGIVSSVGTLIFLNHKKLLKKEHLTLTIIMILAVSTLVASGWEFFEYFSDKIFGGDTQWVQETGVNDTMSDMLIAFLGSTIFSIYYYVQMKINNQKFTKFLDKVL